MAKTPPPLPTRDPGSKAPKPIEAATLIIYRDTGKRLEVLMGERHGKHRFMPMRYVFPGGRVDPTDGRIPTATDMHSAVRTQLERKLTPARAKAMAVAAVRETFEEAGLIIGEKLDAPVKRPPKGWEDFFGMGFAPALHNLTYIGRAVTPPHRPLRFNARFFMIDDTHVQGDIRGSGELADLRWFTIPDALELELPNITRKILSEIEGLAAAGPRRRAKDSVPYFKWHQGAHIRIAE